MPSRPVRLPLTAYADMPVQYVAPWGDDRNDGYDGFRYPKKTFLAAYDYANARHDACEFHVADKTHIGGANQWSPPGTVSVPGQGIWLDGGRRAFPSLPLYPGWRVAMPHRIKGYPGKIPQPQFLFAAAQLLRGNEGDVTKPGVRFDVGYWLTNNLDATAGLSNIFFLDFSIAYRFAVNGNPAGDPDALINRTFDETVAMVYMDQCSGQVNAGDPDELLQGPNVDCGYYLWLYFHQCSFVGSGVQDLTADNRAAILVNPGGGGSCLFDMTECRGAQGGIIYRAGGSTWGIDVNGWLVESDGRPLPSLVKIVNVGPSGRGRLDTIQPADSGGVSEPTIDVVGSNINPSQLWVVGSAGIATRGPCTMVSVGSDQAFPVTDFGKSLKQGFVQGKLWGDSDSARACGPVTAARWRNLHPQHTDEGGETGPIINRPGLPTTNAIYTAAWAVGPNGVATPVLDRFGGFQAFRLASSDSASAHISEWYGRTYDCAVGQRFVVGFWIRVPGGMPDAGSPVQAGLLIPDFSPTFEWVRSDDGGYQKTFKGDGEWQWVAFGATCTSLGGGGSTITISLQFNASPGQPIEVCGITLLKIAANEITDNEFGLLIQNVTPMPQVARGLIGTQVNQILSATGGLAVGNMIAPAGLGAVVKLLPIRDSATGSIIGYCEVKPLT